MGSGGGAVKQYTYCAAIEGDDGQVLYWLTADGVIWTTDSEDLARAQADMLNITGQYGAIAQAFDESVRGELRARPAIVYRHGRPVPFGGIGDA